jgi:hypothetical protein
MGNLVVLLRRVRNSERITLADSKKLQIISSITSLTFMSFVLPVFPKPLAMLSSLVVTGFFCGYSTVIYKYYGSLPTLKKTVQTYLLQDLMLAFSVTKICFVIRTSMMYLFPKNIVELLTKFPNLTCSLLEKSKLRLFSCGILIGIIALKIFAQITPTGYLKMTHEKIRKIILSINFALFIVITVATTNMFGSLCPKIAIDYFEYLTSSELEKKEFNFIPYPLQFLYGVFILILTIVYYLIKRKQTNRSLNMLEKLEHCRTSSNQVANFYLMFNNSTCYL